MLRLSRAVALGRERPAADYIPYLVHLDGNVVRTCEGDYLQALRIGGLSFETSDVGQLNTWYERLNVLWRNVASPEIALWTHLVRRRETVTVPGDGAGTFADRLDHRYRGRLASEVLMRNELYLAVIYRPLGGGTAGAFSRRLARRALQDGVAEALEFCSKLRELLRAALERYDPEPLGVYQAGAQWRSGLLEYLALLVNGERQPIPLPQGPVSEVLATSRVLFGSELIEYRLPAATRLGAMLGIKEYPTPSAVGMFDALLSAPFELVLTQSFSFLSRAAGQGLLQRQLNRMANAGDLALSQAAQLRAALDGLASNEFVMGEHHFSLQLIVDLPPDLETDGSGARTRLLNDTVARARAILADTGMIVAREDLALEAAFWAQLPGNFALRPRAAPITSRNFSAMVPWHNFPAGREHGNHWGEALALLATRAQSPYFFSLHAHDPADPEGGSRRDTGHTFICGPTGSGKTVLIGFLISMLHRQRTWQVVFDKDRGLEILVRALGGVYLPLRNGLPTGFNPLQLPITPDGLEFLKSWLRLLARAPSGRSFTVREAADLEQALQGTLALDPAARRLSRLIEFLDPTDPEGVHARLSRWCESTRGDYAWVFDNPCDLIALPLVEQVISGFDVTDFLDNPVTRPAVTLYLFHLVRRLLDGRRLVCWIDEFWKMLSDPSFADFAQDGPKTWRKLNAVMVLVTQSASDVLRSPISRTIIEQTPTKIFFANVEASEAECSEGFSLTQRELLIIREQLTSGSRAFLVRQGHQSVVCGLDLAGLEAELAVLAGRSATRARMHALLAEYGEAPERWLPHFLADWKAHGGEI